MKNEIVLTFTEHLFRLSNTAQSCSALGSWSLRRLLDVFWCCCSWQRPSGWVAVGRAGPIFVSLLLLPVLHLLSLVAPESQSAEQAVLSHPRRGCSG